jgi:hypothetical protein
VDIQIFSENKNGMADKSTGPSNNVHTISPRIEDPSGIAWEAYQTMADAAVFSEKAKPTSDSSCCVSAKNAKTNCC